MGTGSAWGSSRSAGFWRFPQHLLRPQGPPACSAHPARRPAQGRDRAHLEGELPGVRGPQDLAAAPPGGHRGGPLHRRAAHGELGLQGVVRGKPKRTTVGDPQAERPADLVCRDFTAQRPNQLWVADLTSGRTWSGLGHAAFIIDADSRLLVGWQPASHLRTDLALDALEMAIWRRQAQLDGLVHHSDRGGQYLSIRSTERLAEAGAVTSVGSRGDSFDNALAESTIGLYKTELIRRRGPWRGLDDLELGTLEWVDWYNHRRLHGALDHVPPLEYEAAYNPA